MATPDRTERSSDLSPLPRRKHMFDGREIRINDVQIAIFPRLFSATGISTPEIEGSIVETYESKGWKAISKSSYPSKIANLMDNTRSVVRPLGWVIQERKEYSGEKNANRQEKYVRFYQGVRAEELLKQKSQETPPPPPQPPVPKLLTDIEKRAARRREAAARDALLKRGGR